MRWVEGIGGVDFQLVGAKGTFAHKIEIFLAE